MSTPGVVRHGNTLTAACDFPSNDRHGAIGMTGATDALAGNNQLKPSDRASAKWGL